LSKSVVIFGQLPFSTAKLSLLIKRCT